MSPHIDRIAAVRDGRPVRAFVVCTGAGAGLQKLLWGVPGASRFLAGAAFPYAKAEIGHLLGFAPDHYCDADAAIELAMAAYSRAWVPHVDHAVGLGLTAVVATDRAHRGDHRVFAATVSRTGCRLTSAVLTKEVGPEARLRNGELCDRLGLDALLAAVGSGSVEIPYADTQATDVTRRARDLILSRPFFAADGSRQCAPQLAVHFPGAFDPPHRGHREIAERLRRIGRRVVFSINVDPPHKDAVGVAEMLERAKLLSGEDRLFTTGDPLYLDKARRWRADLAIGTDALQRVLDPRWGVEPGELLREFDELGVRFFVAERQVRGEWITLDSLPIPAGRRHLFCSLGRCAAESSSALRQARA